MKRISRLVSGAITILLSGLSGFARWCDRTFEMEEINGDGRCATYLYRWTLLKGGSLFSIYLHKFVGDDWSIDLHDHPKRFWSVGLWGSYTAITPVDPAKPLYCRTRVYRAPWLRTFPAEHQHRLTGPTRDRPCWTLVIVGRGVRSWGFWPRGAWMHWRTYVGSEIADERKACP